MKKIIISILAIFFISYNIPVNALGTLTEIRDKRISQEKLEKALKEEYGDEYEKILKDNQKQAELGEHIQEFIKKNYGEEIYPDYYGGMYISDNSQYLVIQVVKNNIPTEGQDYLIYQQLISLGDTIKIEYVDNSLNYLNELNSFISEVFKNIYYENHSSNFIDIINNRIVIELKDNKVEEQQKFLTLLEKKEKKVKKISKIKFENLKPIIFSQNENYTNGALKIGQKVQMVAEYCSVGFRTKYKGKAGYVTAGHCTDKVGGIVQTGTIRLRQFKNGEKYDYAFIETDSDSPVLNSYNKPNNQTGIIAAYDNKSHALTLNMIVAKVGWKTGYTTGKITALTTDISVKAGNDVYLIKNLVRASYKSELGDSGGAVMIPKTIYDGGLIAIGVNSSSNDNYSISYFTSINSLPSELQTSVY